MVCLLASLISSIKQEICSHSRANAEFARGLTAVGPKQANDDGPAVDACCVLPNNQPLGILGVPLHSNTPGDHDRRSQASRRLVSYWSSMLNRTKGNIAHTLRKLGVRWS
jgi:hypothetical protein